MPGLPLVYGGPANRTLVSELAASPAGNAALVWTRWFPFWTGAGPDVQRWKPPKPVEREGKEQREPTPIEGFVTRFRNAETAMAPLLAERNARLERAQSRLAAVDGKVLRKLDLTAAWRVATGLGAAHPTENGFTFDQPLGFPVLPGSTVKGLVRAASAWAGEDADRLARWLGPEREDADERAAKGAVTFFDAVPTVWPKLAVDIVNTHHGDWYVADRARRPRGPLETDDPVPVQFLALEAGTCFRFAFIAPKADADAVETRLRDGLADLGIGGKTAAGYGRFSEPRTLPTAPSPGRGTSGTGKSPKGARSAAPASRTAYVYGEPVEILERSQGGCVVRFLDNGDVETVPAGEVTFGG